MEEVTLRPVSDADIALLDRWLRKAHVSRWYENPEEWLDEVRRRKDEYRFIHHFIACIGDLPIGFCQYYDCFDAEENWYRVGRRNTIFSIDYLIGEERWLGRGFGKAMIRALEEIVSARSATGRIIVLPDEDNAASRGTLRSRGFRYDERRGYFVKNLRTGDA